MRGKEVYSRQGRIREGKGRPCLIELNIWVRAPPHAPILV